MSCPTVITFLWVPGRESNPGRYETPLKAVTDRDAVVKVTHKTIAEELKGQYFKKLRITGLIKTEL